MLEWVYKDSKLVLILGDHWIYFGTPPERWLLIMSQAGTCLILEIMRRIHNKQISLPSSYEEESGSCGECRSLSD